MKPFTGCGTALVTPFRADQSLDEAILRRLVRRQIEAGIDFLVPCGKMCIRDSASTGTRPLASSSVISTTRRCSLRVSVGLSPDVPHGTRKLIP